MNAFVRIRIDLKSHTFVSTANYKWYRTTNRFDLSDRSISYHW